METWDEWNTTEYQNKLHHTSLWGRAVREDHFRMALNYNRPNVLKPERKMIHQMVLCKLFFEFTYCENTQITSPSVKSYGKPPTKIQALSLYWSCHDVFKFRFNSSSLNFLTFFTLLEMTKYFSTTQQSNRNTYKYN